MNPSLYDLLDVEPTASDAEIRAAWKSVIADLDPSDRRFRAYNQAAEVLLDPDQRAAYDAQLETRTATTPDADDGAALVDREPPATASPPSAPPTSSPRTGRIPSVLTDLRGRVARPRRAAAAPQSGAGTATAATGKPVPVWLLAGLAVVVAGLIAGVVYFATQPSDTEVAEATRTAQSAAEQAIVPILSYDAKTLDEDQAAAQSRMTSDYRKEYDKLFEAIKENAPRTRTSVAADVIASGVVRSGVDRVEVLLFVNRPTTNRAQRQPVTYQDQVTVTMEKVGTDWLVDDLTTSPVAP